MKTVAFISPFLGIEPNTFTPSALASSAFFRSLPPFIDFVNVLLDNCLL